MKGFISLKNEEIGKGELKNKILLIKVFFKYGEGLMRSPFYKTDYW